MKFLNKSEINPQNCFDLLWSGFNGIPYRTNEPYASHSSMFVMDATGIAILSGIMQPINSNQPHHIGDLRHDADYP
jgi:hypothetical protein